MHLHCTYNNPILSVMHELIPHSWQSSSSWFSMHFCRKIIWNLFIEFFYLQFSYITFCTSLGSTGSPILLFSPVPSYSAYTPFSSRSGSPGYGINIVWRMRQFQRFFCTGNWPPERGHEITSLVAYGFQNTPLCKMAVDLTRSCF